MLLNWVLEKTLESPLDWKEIKPVQPKRNQSWLFIGRTNAEVETPILWPPDALNWLIWKDPDAGKDWRQEENRTTVWDGWMASPTQWTWVWVKSRTWWWTGRPGMLRSLGSPRVRHDWVTELNWTEASEIEEETLIGNNLNKLSAFLLWINNVIIKWNPSQWNKGEAQGEWEKYRRFPVLGLPWRFSG